MLLGGKASGHHLPAGRPHGPLQGRVREQLIERSRKRGSVSGPHAAPADAILQPVANASRGAGHDRPAGRESLDPDKPERLGPNRRHRHHRRFRQLVCQLIGPEPTLEADALRHAKPSREPAHRIQSPAIPTYDELGVHGASGPDQNFHSLGRDDPTCKDDTASRSVTGPCAWSHRGEQGDHLAPSHAIGRQVPIHGAGI